MYFLLPINRDNALEYCVHPFNAHTFRTLHFSQPAYPYSALHSHHSTRALKVVKYQSALRFVCSHFIRRPEFQHCSSQKFGIHSLQLFECVPALTLFIATSRLITASRPSNLFNAFLLAPQIRLLLTTVRIYKLHLLTCLQCFDTAGWAAGRASGL